MPESNGNRNDHAARLVARTRAAGGLAPVDLDRFWADQAQALANPFGADIPQVALGVLMERPCIFTELDIPETHDNWYRLLHDAPGIVIPPMVDMDPHQMTVTAALPAKTSAESPQNASR